MKNLKNLSLEQLKDLKTEAVNKLRIDYTQDKELIKTINAIESQIKELRIIEGLKAWNQKMTDHREKAKIVFDTEVVTEDITTSDGSYHKTKIKKYPKLAALEYCRGEFKEGLLLVIKYSRYEFKMYKSEYSSKEPTKYIRPETFIEFCTLNSIPDNLTLQEYKDKVEALNVAHNKLQEAISEYKKETESLELYKLKYSGLFDQYQEYLYLFRTKF